MRTRLPRGQVLTNLKTDAEFLALLNEIEANDGFISPRIKLINEKRDTKAMAAPNARQR